MSVFQFKEWWQTQLNETEEFDYGCCVIGNVDNANPPTDKVIIGSQSGLLRVYKPTTGQYRVEDLIFEESLNLPILQLLLGRFIPNDDNLAVAILHPRKLIVYELLPQRSKDEDKNITHYSLHRCYEHILGYESKHFTAYNMISGKFGGHNKDMLLVQSMDGKLQIFEQSVQAFIRQLTNCILPQPILYLPYTDAFVICNHSYQLECYRYQVLASAQKEIGSTTTTTMESKTSDESKTQVTQSSLPKLRTAMVEWSITLGETCIQVERGYFSGNDNMMKYGGELLALGEQSLFLIKASGSIIQQRRLEHTPVCLCVYPSTSSSSTPYSSTNRESKTRGSSSSGGGNGPDNAILHNFIIASVDHTIQIFSQLHMIWACKMSHIPVQLGIGSFGGSAGMIVAMSDTGTKPPVSAVVTYARELDYDAIDEEHSKLMKIIKEAQSDVNKESDTERLTLRTQLAKGFDRDNVIISDTLPYSDFIRYPTRDHLSAGISSSSSSSSSMHELENKEYMKICVRLYVMLSGTIGSADVTLSITTPSCIYASPRIIQLDNISGSKSTPISVKVYLYALKSAVPSSTTVNIYANYISPSKNEPRATSHSFDLPLYLFCRPKMPSKTALYKFTIDTQVSPFSMTELFSDFLSAYQEGGLIDVVEVLGDTVSKAIGFQLWTNDTFETDLTNADSLYNEVNSSKGLSSPNSTTVNKNKVVNKSPALVSVIVSKTTGRYRVQSDSVAALWLIANEVYKRLQIALKENQPKNQPKNESKSEFKNESKSDATYSTIISCEDDFIMNEYLTIIQQHYTYREEIRQLIASLNDRAQQYRMIQKRLLVRYKDKNPTPISSLDKLIQETYMDILNISDTIQEIRAKLILKRNDISCLSQLFILFIKLKVEVPVDELPLLEYYLNPTFQETDDIGWEEVMDASLTYILKTSLAKTVKSTITLPSTQIEHITEIETLKKHIPLVYDRLSKGAHIIPATTTTATSIANTSSNSSNSSRT